MTEESMMTDDPGGQGATPEIRVGGYQFMPDMTPEEFAALKADIAERGVVTPIDLDETGAILDGHHRYRAWCELQRNEPPPTIVRAGLSEAEKRSFAIRQNVHRRHLMRGQMQDLIERELRARPDHSDRQIAADVGVDHKTIGRLRRVLNATGELPQLDATVGGTAGAGAQ
jgi:ParB-like chromosome segregation protein Spo0J